MATDVERIVGEYPRRDAVSGQWFDFRPAWWTSVIATDVFDGLPAAPAKGDGWRRIDRSDLFRIAATPGREVDLLIACYAWGMGASTGSLNRYRRPLRVGREILAAKLSGARLTLDEQGPIAAYRSLAAGGPFKVAFLGPSFFTKLLYTMDLSPDRITRALILDQFVVAALNHLAELGVATGQARRLSTKIAWPPAVYEQWLDFAHDEAARASSAAHTIQADAVEVALFKHGRKLVLG